VIPDPQLTLKRYNFSTKLYEDVATNDNWGDNSNAAAITSTAATVGAFTLRQPQEAAMLVDLSAGQYSVLATDKTDAKGIAIVELYDVDSPDASSSLANISNRGFCGVGDDVMITGFVVSDRGPKTFLVRVVGPTLALPKFGVTGTMADPKLQLFKHDSVGNKDDLVLTQDNWGDNAGAASTVQVSQQIGAFALADGSKDAAFVVTLQPGAYTVIGSAADGVSTGVVLVEVYAVP
jgi:hypothetical protein